MTAFSKPDESLDSLPDLPPSRAASVLRALALAVAAVLLCRSLTVPLGIAAAALGAFVGTLLGDRLARGALRLGPALGFALLTLLSGLAVVHGLLASPALAGVLGPVVLLHLSQGLEWWVLGGCFAFALRFAARRRPMLALLEVLVAAVAVVTSFAAHRDGMVHRPLSIGDWAWSRGIDPVHVFLVLGGLGTFLLAALLVREERRRRLPLHFGGLLLVALVLMLVVRVGGLPRPETAGDLGLTGDPASESEGDPEDGEGGEGKPDDSDQMDDLPFKDEYQNQGSQAPVAIVLLHDDYSPPSGVYYFRQTAFSQYNGRRLVRATRDDVDLDVIDRFPFRPTAVESAPPVGSRRQALATSMGLLVDHVRPFALDSPAEIRPIENPDPMRFRRAFAVRSHVPTTPYQDMIGQRPGDADWSDSIWRHYTEAPNDPRYGELAQRLLDALLPEYRGDPLARALVAKDYLDQNGIYCRRSKHASAGDPAASFLFGDLTGYCVHFAHASAYLLRAMGVPSRVAAGYAVAESSRGSGSSVLIRGADAHAWPEIYLENLGWVVVDLTPEQQCDEEDYQQADPDLQRMLGEMMRQQRWQEEGDEQGRDRWTLAGFLGWVARLVGVLLALAYAVKLYRRLAPRVFRRQAHRTVFRAALDHLADLGFRRRYGESRERFATRLATAIPSFGRLTEVHLGTSLGSRRTTPPGDFDGLRRQLAHELGERIPTWRRWLGALDPISWMWVR